MAEGLIPRGSIVAVAIPGDLRIRLDPSEGNQLKAPSHIMLDKLTAIRRTRVGEVIGKVDTSVMDDVTRELALLIGLG